jgi:hypothetical protein
MLTIFGHFRQFSAKKMALFWRTNAMIIFLPCQDCQFFSNTVFGKDIFKIIMLTIKAQNVNTYFVFSPLGVVEVYTEIPRSLS